MTDATPAALPDPLITDDGEIIRLTVRGATWVFRGETARIIRRHRALYKDGSKGASAFWHGLLLTLSIFNPTMELPDGKKERQDEVR